MKKNLPFSGGWIAPDGEFYPVEYGTHGPAGRRIAQQKGIKLKSYEDLTEKGWVRVYGAGLHFRKESMFRILFPQCKNDLRGTQAQLDTLYELRKAAEGAGEDTCMLDDAIRDWIVE